MIGSMNSNKYQALLLGGDHTLAESLLLAVRPDGGSLGVVASGDEAIKFLQNHPLDILFLDLKSAQEDCLSVLRHIRHQPPATPIFTVGFGPAGENSIAIKAFGLGLNEFVQTPFENGVFRARISGAVLLKRTLDELTIRQRELAEACRAAEANARAKSEFLAAMSHEIRTPMNGVVAMTGLLMETHLTPDQRSYVETIYNSSESLLKIINDILDFSKIEAGKMELERRSFDLRACIEESLDLLAPRAFEKYLDLAYQVSDEIPAQVEGDSQRLRQVLINLIGNALKFTERGGVFLQVEKLAPLPVDEGNASLSRLHFAVRDSGIGIPPDRLVRLFRPFAQADAATARKYGGTGLGLAISRRLVELMGGRMWAESEPGAGSTFHFTVKLSTASTEIPAFLQPRQRLARLKILILEDAPVVRNLLADQCRRWGMNPHPAESSAQVVELLRGGAVFDLALVDAHLPDVDGAAVAAEMQKIPAAAKMPVVFMTTPGKKNSDGGGTEVFFAHHVSKPVKPGQLCAVLEQSLSSPRLPARPVEPLSPEIPLAQRYPLHLLVVDDNAINTKVAARILHQLGYQPEVATNGLEAVKLIEKQPFDLVFMDVMMPEMDGFEATRHIRKIQTDGQHGHLRPQITIVAMTAHAMPGDREKCLAAGMDDYLAKPIRPKEVRDMIEKWAGKAGSAGEGGFALPAAAVPAEAEAPVDMSRVNDLTDGNADSLRELMDIYFKQTGGQFNQMRDAIRDGKADHVRRVAHSCAGASATLGMIHLVPKLRELEKLGASGTLTGAGEICDNAAAEFERIRKFLKAQPELAAVIPDSIST
jgi:signal transduction histidine kinase/HPt (histidine-containing phosphotransfer) domain-containing protein